jgi:GNAT superfamily N-acetyltransferase
MRAQEFVAEYKKYPTADYEGVTFTMVEEDGFLTVKALNDFGISMASVIFGMDGRELDPQSLRVDEKYRGQGIARVMYDYVKSRGFVIHRSWDQTDAGAGFWDKHRGEDVRVWESFDRPYAIDWEDSEYGDIDALATLDDGTHLSIMFNQESGHDGRRPSHWSVEFYRNNSQEVTGEGDAQKIFATVLSAIQQFIKKENPGSISFSASKEPEVDMTQPGANANPESRAKLYNRLVQRYASSMGYSVQQQEGNGKVTYTLRQAKPGVAEEEQLDELSFLGSECTKDCSGHRAGYDWSKRKGLRQANSWSPSFNKGAGLAVAGK